MRNSNTKGGRIPKVLVLALALVMLAAGTAFAAEANSWATLRSLVNSNTSEIVLTDDIVIAGELDINRGKDITIDLNGHTLSRGTGVGTMFNVTEGGQLTFKDSAVVSVSRSETSMPARDNNAADGTGIGRPATLSGGKLTYYETVSTPNGIYTTEKHEQVVVQTAGQVLGGNSNAAMIRVRDNGSALRVEGGLFYNSTGRAVQAGGGTVLEFVGGYFYGNNAGTDRGGAVYAEGWSSEVSLTFGGEAGKTVVFAGNKAATGGAVATDGNADIKINNGAVFSGNAATGNGRDGGGALYIGQSGHAEMSGGLVTHNWGTANVVGTEDSSSYDAGGGGILIRGALKMTGGQVTSNEAAGGGGISTYFWDGGTFSMTDGIVAGNVARLNEGGGITVNMNGSASITGGYITNNTTETNQHWGGGGLFASDYSVVTMQSVLISDNDAGGFGGGLAGCSTGRIDAHADVNMLDHSVAVYNNNAKGTQLSGDASTKSEDRIYAANDPVFMRDNGAHFQDYFCALNTTVCGGFLGGGTADWSGTVDGRALAQGTIKQDERVTSQYITGLTSHPINADIEKAKAKATVFVTGNTSGTHGGGILCNGYMIIGTHREMEIGDRMTIMGDKTLSGAQLKDGQFTFLVKDEKGDVIATGKNNAAGEIVFDGRIPFDEAGTYVFTIVEDTSATMDGVTMDEAVYTMTVVVRSTSEKIQVATAEDPTKTETIQVTFNKISSVKIEKSVAGGAKQTVANYTNISSDDRNAYELPFEFEFVNRTSKDTGFVVSKTIHDLSNASGDKAFQFKVELSDKSINGTKGQMSFTNGVATFTLKGGESKKATGLPAGTTFTITETPDPNDGYVSENPIRSGTVVQDEVASIVFVNRAVGDLKLSKKVVGGTPYDMDDRVFDFKVTLIPSTNINGDYGLEKPVVFENGVAYVSLKHGESVTIEDLPAGLRYEVQELTTDGFDVNETTMNGTIGIGTDSAADFVNTRNTGELHIKKHVVGSDDPTESFNFKVELIGSEYINGTYGDMTFTNGVATVALKDGETKKAIGLPTGTKYRITEERNKNYAVGIVGQNNGTILDAPTIVEYTNTKFAGLVIGKETTGTIIDRNKHFDFEITISHPSQTLADEYSGVKFTGGKATVSLRDGEYVAIEGLPGGTAFTVAEKDVDSGLYTVVINDVVSTDYTYQGTLADGENERVDFSNLRKVGELQLTKTTVSPIAYDSSRIFTFNVTLSEAITGRFGDMMFTNGSATVYVQGGQTVTAKNIPVGITYTVTEVADHDFDSVGTGTTGTISTTVSKASFTNTRRVGDLVISKTVDGTADANDEFGFKIVLDRNLNGKFGDVNFVDGVGEFTLKAGEEVTVKNLPENLVFTVIETTFDSLQYKPVVGSISGDIEVNATTKVEFVNEVLGSLKVSKTITGDGADKDKKFEFTVTLGDTTINGLYGTMEFVNGVATFELGHGESKTATGLPEGTTYTVTEESEGYTVTKTGDTGSIVADATAEAKFTNELMLERGSLKVSKTITGTGADKAKKFSFTVTLSDTRISGLYGDMTFANGVASFKLGHAESKTAAGLPAGITYKVEELDAGNYLMTSENAAGTIAANKTAEAKFVNHLDEVEVPKTGDEFTPMMYTLMLAISAVLLLVLLRKAHKA